MIATSVIRNCKPMLLGAVRSSDIERCDASQSSCSTYHEQHNTIAAMHINECTHEHSINYLGQEHGSTQKGDHFPFDVTPARPRFSQENFSVLHGWKWCETCNSV